MTSVDDLRKAAEAAREQALASLHPRNRKLVEQVMSAHPSLTLAEALAMLNAAGM